MKVGIKELLGGVCVEKASKCRLMTAEGEDVVGIFAWLSVLGGAQASGVEAPCLTLDLMRSRGAKPPMVNVAPPPSLPAKGERDAWGEWPNSSFSENFVLKWGPDSLSRATTDTVLDAFEASWDRFVNDMDYEAPVGSDQFRFNVYVAETGQGSLSSYGAAGYFSYDSDGWPMIVLARNALDAEDAGAGTAVHEFFHAIQDAMDTWDYVDLGGWYYEATACWSVPEVIPGDKTYLTFVFGYGLLPNYAVNFFDYFDTGAFTEYHQYGAFLFPRYLTEHVSDWQIIRDSWQRNNSSNDPLQALMDLLDEEDIDFDQTFMDFAAHNALWDYEDGDWYSEYINYYASYFSEWDCRVSDSLPSGGDSDWREADSGCLPQRYGYNLIRLNRPDQGHAVLEFDGDSSGSRGTPSSWGLQWAQSGKTGSPYRPVALEDGLAGGDVFCDAGEADELWLAVANLGERFRDNETFDYRYRLEILDSHPECGDSPEDTGAPQDSDAKDTGDAQSTPGEFGGFGTQASGGCACSAGAGEAARTRIWFLGLFGLLVSLRRRRN